MLPQFARPFLLAGLMAILGWLPIGLLARPQAGAHAALTFSPVLAPITTPVPAQVFLPLTFGPEPGRIVIAAAHIDSALSGEGDEAILLWNVGGATQSLAGWQLGSGTRQATFPLTSTLELAPQEHLWCTGRALSFRASFGESPACEWSEDSDPTVPNLEGRLTLANSGGVIQLRNGDGALQDMLVYGIEDSPQQGWNGLPAQVYTRGDLSATGQVWQRKRDPQTGQPKDSDQASDWAGDLADLTWGRSVRFPGWQGWSADDLAWPVDGAASAAITVAVGPEGLYHPLAELLGSAQQTIDLSIYTLEHPELTQVLAEAAQRGVRVRMLLEGSPPGGISDLQKWCVARLVEVGSDVRYSAVQEGAPTGLRTRYRYNHAKYGVVDGAAAFVGTDNLTYDSMPLPGTTPVGGRRGFFLFTDAIPVVNALGHIFANDWSPDRFADLHPFQAGHARFGGPPADFALPPPLLYNVIESPFRTPTVVYGPARFVVFSAPENSLRPDAGLLALLARAGVGDEIMLMQLYEHKNWGSPQSNPIADPNPRLQAVVDAARRGARVRLLLDSYFDEPEDLRSNRATVDYLQALAAAEGFDLSARVGNPTLGGIHAKLVLAHVAGEAWSVVGSLNGGEISHKVNREVVMMTDMAGVYDRLREVFEHDWALAESTFAVVVPVVE